MHKLLVLWLSQVALAQLIEELHAQLTPRLSEGATITANISTAPRWSDYHAPEAGFVVHVAEEQDVAETVHLP